MSPGSYGTRITGTVYFLSFFFLSLWQTQPVLGTCQPGFSDPVGLFQKSTVLRLDAYLKISRRQPNIQITTMDRGHLNQAEVLQNKDVKSQPDCIRFSFSKRPLSFGIFAGSDLLAKKLIRLDDLRYARTLITNIAMGHGPHSLDQAIETGIVFIQEAYQANQLDSTKYRRMSEQAGFQFGFFRLAALWAGATATIAAWALLNAFLNLGKPPLSIIKKPSHS